MVCGLKHLVAVMCCHKRSSITKTAAQRDTWVAALRAAGTDVIFFRGRSSLFEIESQVFVDGLLDEVWLDVEDDYRSLVLKVRAIYRWAIEHGYDYISKTDDDVYIAPVRFQALPIAPHEYVGRFRGPSGGRPAHYASGFFYSVSARAARIVAQADWYGEWMDERFVAHTLAHSGIYGHTDTMNYLVTGPFIEPSLLPKRLGLRDGTVFCEYGPFAMREMHTIFADTKTLPQPELLRAPSLPVSYSQMTASPNDKPAEEKINRA